MLLVLAAASRSASIALCWVAFGVRLVRNLFFSLGRFASDGAGAPPMCAWVDLRVRAPLASRRQAQGVAPSQAGVRCFGSAAPRLRFYKHRPACVLACGLRRSCLVWHRSLRSGGFGRNVGPNNSFKPTPLRGVVIVWPHPAAPASAFMPQRRGLIQVLGLGKKLSNVVGSGSGIALSINRVVLGRLQRPPRP